MGIKFSSRRDTSLWDHSRDELDGDDWKAINEAAKRGQGTVKSLVADGWTYDEAVLKVLMRDYAIAMCIVWDKNDARNEVTRLRNDIDTLAEQKMDTVHLGWVYVVGSCEEGLFKIGMTTRTPSERLSEFTPKLPFETELICAIRAVDAWRFEQSLHGTFENKQTNGEWFRLNDEDLFYLTTHARWSGGIVNSECEHRAQRQKASTRAGN